MATSTVLMIRPVHFCYNQETSVTNPFQRLLKDEPEDPKVTNERAQGEFDGLAATLRSNGIQVLVIDDTPEPHTPDSVFPNNWISFHTDGTICLYPMYAVNRRLERKEHVLESIRQNFEAGPTLDFTRYEQTGVFLEGTGSMVLDRVNRIAYACVSPRTDRVLFEEFCSSLNFRPVSFVAEDEFGRAIYHTNVMMCVGETFAIVCTSVVKNELERQLLVSTLEASGKEVVEIEPSQMTRFAGNALQLQNKGTGEKLLFMSSQAYGSLRGDQIQTLRKHNAKIVHVNVDTIEINGGGSVRCMLAEIFLPAKSNLGLKKSQTFISEAFIDLRT